MVDTSFGFFVVLSTSDGLIDELTPVSVLWPFLCTVRVGHDLSPWAELSCGLFLLNMSYSSLVVQSCSRDNWSSNTSSNLDPLMWFSSFTDMVFKINQFTSKEVACLMVLPHVISGCFSSSNLTSWKCLNRERFWESEFLHHEERSADLWSIWDTWLDWNLLLVRYPFLSFESVPLSLVVFEHIATIMPVSLEPFPSFGSESIL